MEQEYDQRFRLGWPGLGAPPVRPPVALVGYKHPVDGRRLVLRSVDGWIYDQRAVGEPYLGTDGQPTIDSAEEADWYSAKAKDWPPEIARRWHTWVVWIESGPPVFAD